MTVKIVSKTKNPFFEREEIVFEGESEKSTPSRQDVKAQLVALTNSSDDRLLVKEIKNRFGAKTFSGKALLYNSAEKAKKTHPVFMLKRNKMLTEEELKKIADAKIKAQQKTTEKK